jgi:hypothetical protein
MENKMFTGNNLRELRVGLRLTQAEFYSSLKFEQSYGNKIENHCKRKSIPKRLKDAINKRYTLESQNSKEGVE